MKNKIIKKLGKIGARLVATKFGIFGDWLVITRDNQEIFFPTLGQVNRWMDTL